DAGRAVADPLPLDVTALDQVTFLGRGWTVGLANEAALKCREAAGFWTEAYPAMEYRHGPVSITGPGRAVWAFGEVPARLRDDVGATILDVAAGLAGKAENPRAVGIVVPGVVDEVNGVASFSSNIGWRDLPLRALTEDKTGLPTALGHDVRAGGLAEARMGAAQGAGSSLFMPVGTGIASAFVLADRVYPGAHGAAGEIGHIVIRPGGRPCLCGQRGCL